MFFFHVVCSIQSSEACSLLLSHCRPVPRKAPLCQPSPVKSVSCERAGLFPSRTRDSAVTSSIPPQLFRDKTRAPYWPSQICQRHGDWRQSRIPTPWLPILHRSARGSCRKKEAKGWQGADPAIGQQGSDAVQLHLSCRWWRLLWWGEHGRWCQWSPTAATTAAA